MEEEMLKKILIGIVVVLLLALTFWAIIGKSMKDAPMPNNIYGNNFKNEWDGIFNNVYTNN